MTSRPCRLGLAALAALVLPLAGAPGAAAAGAWEVVSGQSIVTFDYVLNGEPRSGRFTRFEGGGVLDPDTPSAARFELRIEAASIDLGNALFSAFATSAEWFDARNHPVIRFGLGRLRPLGGDRYEATGDLAIRGRSLPVTAVLTLGLGAAEGRAEVRASVGRADYGIGLGPSALVVDVGREVSVRVGLVARPVTAAE